MLLLLASCLAITDAEHADRLAELGVVVPENTDPPTLLTVMPDFGTDDGGTTVTLVGTGFVGDVEVHFGTEPAVIESMGPDVIEVRSPTSLVTGVVDISVTTPGGEAILNNAYTFWEDADGLVGATGELVWFQSIGGYWAEELQWGRSLVRFTEPFDHQFFWFWSRDLGECTRVNFGVKEVPYEPDFDTVDVREGRLVQQTGARRIELEWNQVEERFTYYDLESRDFVFGRDYSLTLQDTVGLPEVDMADVFRVPAEFVIEEPDMYGKKLGTIAADQQFRWSTEETGDVILMQVGIMDADDNDFVQELHCAVADVGSFSLPGELWTEWVPGRTVQVLFGRYNGGNGLLPWNRGRIAVASQVWYYGAAISE